METNDTISTAIETGINEPSSGFFTFSEEIGNNEFDENDVDLYAIDLSEGQSITIDIDAEVNGSSLDSVLRVFDVDGNQVAVNDDDDFSLDSLIDFVAGQAGRYYIGVSQFNNFGYDPNVADSGGQLSFNGGEYQLGILVNDPVVFETETNDTIDTAIETGINELSSGLFTFSEEIGNNEFVANDVDLYVVDLLEGQGFIADIDASINNGDLDSVLRVFDADGNEVAVDDDGDFGLDSLIDFVAGQAGRYFVGVSQFNNFDYDPNEAGSGDQDFFNGGEYQLNILANSPVTVINGNGGSNTIAGTTGLDLIRGKGGNDTINGRAGNDTISGGTGRDLIDGANGSDSIFGGLGADTLSGRNGADTLSGGENRDSLLGGSGNDLLQGNQDRDTLRGEGGNDSLSGGTGNDKLFGGTGDDTVEGGQGDDFVNGDGGSDRLFGDSGADTIRGGGGNDFIVGGTDGDLIFGNLGEDTIRGGDGADTLEGQLSSDTLRGQAGDDVLNGGSGDDLLIGGSGRDIITGGDGSDSFLYENSRHGLDTITDFGVGDRIILTDLLNPPNGNQTFNSATPFEDYVRLVQVGSDTRVRFDSGGDQVASQFVTLAVLENIDVATVTADKFVF